MDSNDSTRAPDPPPHPDDEAAQLARRIEAERKIADLAKSPVTDPTFTTTAILIIATVALAVIVALLYFAMR